MEGIAQSAWCSGQSAFKKRKKLSFFDAMRSALCAMPISAPGALNLEPHPFNLSPAFLQFQLYIR